MSGCPQSGAEAACRVDRRQAARYLGYGGRLPEGEAAALLESCCRELEEAAVPRRVSRLVPVETEEESVRLAGVPVESRDLAERLEGCRDAVLTAVTLGAPVDRLLHKYGRTDVSRAAVLDAAAGALLESVAAAGRAELAQAAGERGLYLLPPFGPGYGDFPLEAQGLLLSLTDAGRRIGLTMTGGGMLAPSKSLTAVLGLTCVPQPAETEKCRHCDNFSCPYRKA